jgi:hypothetical protein
LILKQASFIILKQASKFKASKQVLLLFKQAREYPTSYHSK